MPCEGPRVGGRWKNHGEYVVAVMRLVRQMRREGALTEREARRIFTDAVRSNCGKEINRSLRPLTPTAPGTQRNAARSTSSSGPRGPARRQ